MQPVTVRVGVVGIATGDVADALRRVGDIEPVPAVDIEAATMLVEGDLSFLVGVCESGGGAALAIPIAIAGADKCINLSKLGRPMAAAEIPKLIEEGKRAFGIARDHISVLAPQLGQAILASQDRIRPAS
jgi:hypothetical protein